MKKVFLTFFIILLIFLSLFPRSIDVLNGNPVFGFDHGRDYLAVKHIVIDHKLTLIGAELGAGAAGFSYLFQGPGYYYLLVIPFLIFNGNPVGGVIVMLILGLATIVFGYYFTTKLLGWKAGFITAFLLATSPYLIPQSRFFWNPHAPTLFILIAFYYTYLVTKNRGKKSFIFIAAFFSAFIYNFEIAIAIPLCITLFVYSILLFRKKIILYVSLFIGFFIGFFPMILFESRHGFMGLHNLFSYLFIHKSSKESGYILLHSKDILNTFLSSFADSFSGKLLFPPIIIAFCFIILIIFVFLKEKDKIKKSFIVYLLLLIPVNFLVFSFLRNNIYTYYFTDLTLSYIFLFTYCFTWLFNNRFYKISAGISIYLLILLCIAIINAVRISTYDYQDYGGTAKLKGKIDAIDFIYKDANGKPFGLLVFSPPVYTYPYDYIVWWYGQRKYGYSPYVEKKGTFYLLVEVDGSNPSSYKGWEETVIKTGKVIYTKTLPSGFIVEKRISDK